MKAFVSAIAALAATASAKPYYGLGLGYGGYGLAAPYGLGLGAPLAAPLAPLPDLKKCVKEDAVLGLPVLSYDCLTAAEEEAAAPAEEAKEKRSADAQLYGLGYGYGGYGLGYGGYGLGLPVVAPVELKCKDPWGLPALCPAEPEEAAKEKRSADAQILGYGLPYGGIYGGYGLALPALRAPLGIELNCKNAYGLPVPCEAEGGKADAVPIVVPVEEAAKEKRSADAQIYGLGYGGYGYGGLGYGLAAPILPAPVELNCKNAWGWPVLCAQEGEADAAPAEEAAKEKRSADAQLYLAAPLGGLGPWGLPGPFVHSSLLGICTNVDGDQVDC